MGTKKYIPPLPAALLCMAVSAYAASSSFAVTRQGRTWPNSPIIAVEYRQGYGFFSMYRLNTYYIDSPRRYADTASHWKQFFDRNIIGGHDIEIELSTFIGDFMQVSVSYLLLKSMSENDTIGLFNGVEYDFFYLDVVFRGLAVGTKYFIINHRSLKVFAGGKTVLGKGGAHLGYGRRPDNTFGAYADDNFSGQGIGLSAEAGADYKIFPYVTFGITGGYRILRTEVLRNVIDGAPWRRPPADPHNINLDFSGFFIQGKVSFEL